MRLLRVRVEDFRGIDAHEVTFATEGVTVVEAPNERGKSSLLDAVDLLLKEKDSSRKKTVRDVKPVGRDVGSVVEVELRCGPYRLTCRKRFNKQPTTELTVHEPVREQHTGTEAHDRLRALLEAEVDLALYEALRFTQGSGLGGVALGASNVLAARLDEVAGGSGQAGDDDLLARVRAEYERYFTPKGQPGKRLRQADEAVAAARARHDELAERLRALEVDVEELARVQQRYAEVTAHRAELVPEVARRQERRDRVERLRQRVQQLRATAAGADDRRDLLAREHTDRRRVAERLAEDGRHHDRVAEELAPLRERLTDLDAQVAELADETRSAEADLADARREREVADLLAELGRLADEHERLQRRRARVDEVLAEAGDAEAFLADCRLDEDALEEIREADQQERGARAALAAGAPTVTVRPRRELDLEVDGTTARLEAGAEVTHAVEDRLSVTVADLGEVEVVAGTSLSDLRARVDEARERCRRACAAAGVADPEAAEALASRRREHLAALRRRDADLDRALEGATREQLADRLRLVGGRLRTLHAQLPAEEVVPAVADAEERLVKARDAEEEAEQRARRLRTERDAVREEAERLRVRATSQAAQLSTLAEELERQRERLAGDRERVGDDELLAELHAAEEAATDAHTEVARVEGELAELDPESVELLAANAERRLADADAELEELQGRRTALAARLEVVGQEGLGEQRDEAAAELVRAEAEQRRVAGRAAAAGALYEELLAARDEAYRAYQQPLRDLIARQGRIVFGDDLEVELDEELRVVRRTLGGDTLDWEQLSSGAREQLTILSALAAARLAADDGVPLVLDDALGASDPDRLAALGAVLGAADGAQVIVLTCVGERYRHVGGATTVRLGAQLPAA